MMTQQATIPMQPFGKARPRVTRSGHAYMPDSYTTARDELRLHFGSVEVPPPWIVSIVAVRPMPKSWSKAKRHEMDSRYCETKPDADNIAGAVMDALFADDAAVVSVTCVKRWGDAPALIVTVEKAE